MVNLKQKSLVDNHLYKHRAPLKHLFLYVGFIEDARAFQLMSDWKSCFSSFCNTLTTVLENCKDKPQGEITWSHPSPPSKQILNWAQGTAGCSGEEEGDGDRGHRGGQELARACRALEDGIGNFSIYDGQWGGLCPSRGGTAFICILKLSFKCSWSPTGKWMVKLARKRDIGRPARRPSWVTGRVWWWYRLGCWWWRWLDLAYF